VVPRVPAFVVLGGLNVVPEPPTDHVGRDPRHAGEHGNVKNSIASRPAVALAAELSEVSIPLWFWFTSSARTRTTS